MTTATTTPRETPLATGDTAPNFTLLDQDRNEVTLESLLAGGKDVVLSFFPFAFTGVCTKEMECFTADVSKFESASATVVGVSCDSFAALKAFADAQKIGVPMLSDQHREVCRAYGIYWAEMNVSRRATFVIGSDGVVKWASVREPGDQISNADLLGALSAG